MGSSNVEPAESSTAIDTLVENIDKESHETAEVAARAFQQAVLRAEEKGRLAKAAAEELTIVAKEAAEMSASVSRDAVGQAKRAAEESIKVATKAAEESIRSSREAMSQAKAAAEEATRAAREAADKSLKMSEEAINTAGDITKSAREIIETSIRVARETIESSELAAREAIGVFREMIGYTEGLERSSQQVTKQFASTQIGVFKGSCGKIEEAADEAPGETAEAPVKTFGEADNEAGADLKGVKEAKEVQHAIETRLESLARMYSSYHKAEEAGEGNEN